MIKYDKDIQNLKKELKETVENEKKKNEEFQKDMVLFSFFLFLLCPL